MSSILCTGRHPRILWMRSSRSWMRSSRVVRASDCQCRSHNSPGFDPSSLWQSRIWGAAASSSNIVSRLLCLSVLLVMTCVVTVDVLCSISLCQIFVVLESLFRLKRYLVGISSPSQSTCKCSRTGNTFRKNTCFIFIPPPPRQCRLAVWSSVLRLQRNGLF